MVPLEMEPHVISPVGEFSFFCMFCVAVLNHVDLDVGCAGAHEGDDADADASLRQMVQR
jgi:hypothetical protein